MRLYSGQVPTSFRPQADGRYLARPRLLESLPEEPGFVVWLEAPYGYGKSVLASQWAHQLELDGWRVLWLTMADAEPRSGVAVAVGLPAASPWSPTLDALWSQKTLLVLEELEALKDHEDLVPLLRDVRGLVLLASRGPLITSEIPRLTTTNRLTHLQATDLGFTDFEALHLFEDDATARTLWEQANGWPLPLHFASITGALPENRALIGGMRASLSPEEWQETLLLATVPLLPAPAATPTTSSLAATGFVQLGEAGYRLHTLVAEAIVAAFHDDALAALRGASDRLPEVLYGEALERLGDSEGLAGLLEAPRTQVYRRAPGAYLRWDEQLAQPASALRHVTVGAALKIIGKHEAAVKRLRASLEIGGMAPDDELFALKELCWSLAIVSPQDAYEVIARGEALLHLVDPVQAGRFLADAAFVDIIQENHDAAAASLERAIAILPADSPFRIGPQINLALNRWDEHGDYDGRLAAQTNTLEAVQKLYPSDATGQARDLAMMHWWAGDLENARRYLDMALEGERANPPVGVQARAGLAALDGNMSAFSGLMEAARAWNHDVVIDAVAMHAIDTLPDTATLEEVNNYYDLVPKPALATAAYAKRLAAFGKRDRALSLIDDALASFKPRAYGLYLMAARFLAAKDQRDLDALVGMTSAGVRLLPGLVPIEHLPSNRPDLAAAYDIEALLASGWNEAVALRLEDLPDLELQLLGRFRLKFAGNQIDLTERHKQLVALLSLGLSREEVAEAMWPEADAAKQRNNMGVQFSLLRRALEPWGATTYVYEEGLKRLQTDHADLLAALEANDADRVLRAYTGSFAPGLTPEPIGEHRNWLQERVVELLYGAAEQDTTAKASSYLAKVIELDPLHEEALRALLRNLVSRGRVREARRQFDDFAQRLNAELGVDPMPETAAVLGA